MEIAHIAHSTRCALLLDDEGVCRWFVLKVEDEAVASAAERCVGAQFVATLDADAPGLLGKDPKVGTNLLLARVHDGRVSLVRFGPLSAFETLTGARAEQALRAHGAEETEEDETKADDDKPALEPETTRVPVPPAEESDVTLQRHAPRDTLADLADVGEDEDATKVPTSSPRASGFAIRLVPPAEDTDLPTHRFEREDAPKRGVLPRRKKG